MALNDNELLALSSVIYDQRVMSTLESAARAGRTMTLGEAVCNVLASGELTLSGNQARLEIERVKLMQTIVNDPSLSGLFIYDVDPDTAHGAYNACFMDGSGQPYIVFQGTGSDAKGGEWPDNFTGLSGSDTYQQQKAAAYVERIHDQTNRDVVVTGHSKGGNKAMYVTITTPYVSHCASFDGQGFSQEFVDTYRDQIDSNSNRIHQYAHVNDIVNALLINIAGETTYIDTDWTNSDEDYLQNHQPYALFDENGDIAIGDGDSVRSNAAEQVNKFTVWLEEHAPEDDREIMGGVLSQLLAILQSSDSDEEKKERLSEFINDNIDAVGLILAYILEYPELSDFANALADVFVEGGVWDWLVNILVWAATSMGALHLVASRLSEMSGIDEETINAVIDSCQKQRASVKNQIKSSGSSSGGRVASRGSTHDFSDEKLNELIGIIKEINSEQWYDVSRWDVWYRTERFFGRLTIDNYQNDLKTYYRKVFDIQDTSESEIRDRFNRARNEDGTYGKAIRSIVEEVRTVRASIDAFSFGG